MTTSTISVPQAAKSYKELLTERAELEAQIQTARALELAQALSQVKTLVHDFGLTAQDVFGAVSTPNANGARGGGLRGKVAPKYRDPATGQTWTGRGKAPAWIAGSADRSPFVIAPPV